MLDRWRRRSQWVGAAALAVFGLAAVLFPEWAVGQFPWNAGPMMAATVGAWGIGTAVMSTMAAASTRLDRMLGLNVYAWLFGILQLLVILAFLDRLQGNHVLTWPYVFGLVALTASAVFGLLDVAIRRPDLRGPAGTVTMWMKAIAMGLGGFTALLALGTLVAGADGYTAQGGYLPERLSLFSIRAFAAFFAAISAATLSLLLPRNPRPAWELDRGGFILAFLVLVAALLNLDEFDFGAHPGGLVYVGAYAAASLLFAVIWVMPRFRPDLFAADPPQAVRTHSPGNP